MASIKKITTNAGQDVGKRNPHILLVGMKTSTSIMEIRMEVPQKTKNRPTL
jgi:hypothetical protein